MNTCDQCSAELTAGDECPRCTPQPASTHVPVDSGAVEVFTLRLIPRPGPAPSAVTVNDPLAVVAATAPRTVVEPPRTSLPDAGPLRLVVVRGERLGAGYPLLDGRNYIGRSADQPVDIDLNGQEAADQVWVSRVHAAITVGRGAVTLEDLNSLNGTFVNRHRVHPRQVVALKAGDVIQVGTVQLRVEG
jgi:hypothetical protein